MKKLLFLTFLFTQLFGCNNNEIDEPIEYNIYYTIKDESGNDFFIHHSETYDLSESKTKLEFRDLEEPLRYVTIGDRTIFELAGGAILHLSFIDYRNGDIDTLKFLYDDSDQNIGLQGKKLECYFNGEKFGEWDFISDPDAFYDMERRNSTNKFDKPDFNPVLFELIKRPESLDNR
jgi:hypothetical protein